MTTMAKVPDTHPLMKEWDRFKGSEEYRNSLRHAVNPDHTEGSLWTLFSAGWKAAVEKCAADHESINPASDAERLNGDPGAGAMGAVVEYRDEIRKNIDFWGRKS